MMGCRIIVSYSEQGIKFTGVVLKNLVLFLLTSFF